MYNINKARVNPVLLKNIRTLLKDAEAGFLRDIITVSTRPDGTVATSMILSEHSNVATLLGGLVLAKRDTMDLYADLRIEPYEPTD